MGRGIAYPHRHKMLFDEEHFTTETGVQGEDGEYYYSSDGEDWIQACIFQGIEPPQFPETEHDHESYEAFKGSIIEKFDLDCKQEWLGNETYLMGKASVAVGEFSCSFGIGIDSSGGGPCVFARMDTEYTDAEILENGEADKAFDEAVTKGFNELIDLYPNIWSYPTGSYTSESIDKYPPSE